MVENAIKEIHSKLNCSKCPNILSEPKLLPCFHVFCKSPCLEELATQDPEGKTLTCPICEYKLTLPENGVAGLPTDFQTQYLLKQKEALERAKNPQCGNCKQTSATKYCEQCSKYICDKCRDLHQTWEAFSDHTLLDTDRVNANATQVLAPAKEPLMCEKHPKMKLRMYCEDSSELICSDCTVRAHKGHRYDLVIDVYQHHRDELQLELNSLSEKLNLVNQALKDLDARDNAISSQRDTIKADIKKEIQELRDILDEREKELIFSLNNSVRTKRRQIASHIKEVKIMESKINSCLTYGTNGLETGTESEVLRMRKPMLKRIEEITAEFDPEAIRPKTDADIELVTNEKVQKVCQEYGEIASDPISPENSYATDMGTKFALMDTPTSAQVHPVTKSNKNSEQNFHLKAKLVHVKSGATFKCAVSQENGRHTITYQPVSRGAHSLHIRVNGTHIQGSPFSIAVTPSPTSCFHRPITIAGYRTEPHSIAVNSQGHILITEHKTACVSILTLKLGDGFTFGDQITQSGKLRWPFGVTVDNDDNVYVVDNHRYPGLPLANDHILKFDSKGIFQKIVGRTGSGDLQFNHPIGIHFNKINQLLYVCDKDNHRIQVLTTDLTFVRSIGEKGEDEGEFNCPRNLAFDSDNNLYVTDSGNNRIQVFTTEGNFLRAFSNKANEKALVRPNAIAIDSSNVVYVSELDTQHLSMFTAQGEYFASFGQDRQFRNISGLAIDCQDRVLVSDYHSNKLQIF